VHRQHDIGKGERKEGREGGRGGGREGGREGMYLVVEGEALVGVLHQLVHRQHSVVGLNHRVRDLKEREEGREGGTERGREEGTMST
jgi:hypothetical protein